MITWLHLFRHGETEWNALGLMQGHADAPLSPAGEAHARQVQATLSEDFEVAYASSSGRALRTAELLLKDTGLPIRSHDDLREINLGQWEGQHRQAVQQQDAERYSMFWEDPVNYQPLAGETFAELWARATAAINHIKDAHAGKSVLVVSHAATVKAILTYFSGRSLDQIWAPPMADNLSHSIIEFCGAEASVTQFCGQPWDPGFQTPGD